MEKWKNEMGKMEFLIYNSKFQFQINFQFFFSISIVFSKTK